MGYGLSGLVLGRALRWGSRKEPWLSDLPTQRVRTATKCQNFRSLPYFPQSKPDFPKVNLKFPKVSLKRSLKLCEDYLVSRSLFGGLTVVGVSKISKLSSLNLTFTLTLLESSFGINSQV